MAEGTPTAPESPSVQAFIQQRQADLLARAIATIATCPRPDLPQELHRLSGTLGTYQLLDARSVVQDLETVVRTPDVGSLEIAGARAAALDRLGTITITHRADEGETSQ